MQIFIFKTPNMRMLVKLLTCALGPTTWDASDCMNFGTVESGGFVVSTIFHATCHRIILDAEIKPYCLVQKLSTY